MLDNKLTSLYATIVSARHTMRLEESMLPDDDEFLEMLKAGNRAAVIKAVDAMSQAMANAQQRAVVAQQALSELRQIVQ